MNNHQPYQFRSASPRHSVELLHLTELSEDELERWKELASTALSPNPFLEPHFVLPLIEHFAETEVWMLVVRDCNKQWLFAAPVIRHFFDTRSPLAKLRSFRSKYSFLDHPLVSPTDPVLTLTCLLDALAGQRLWHGLGFAKVWLDSRQHELLSFAAEVCGVELHLTTQISRPAITPQSSEQLLEKLSSTRRKSLKRGWKELEKQGTVEYRLTRSTPCVAHAASEFLRLENLGWKSEQGTSLASHAADQHFFLAVSEQFGKEERILFGELLLNGTAIAVTCNLLSGETLFAYKIGWDPEFAKCSLGYWSEILLADAVFQEVKTISLIDSCSDEDSYTGKVWNERIPIGNSLLIWSRRERMVQNAKHLVNKIVNR